MFARCRPLSAWLLTTIFCGADPLWAQTRVGLPQNSTPAASSMKLARDEFLRQNHWVESRGQWQAFKVAPRNVEAMTGDQLRHESAQLTRTHQWDEASQRWLKRERRPGGKSVGQPLGQLVSQQTAQARP